tara:strand:- start:562 stop:1464 length:903 start_codon:yes stop_codon:yes gene_type:complete
LAQNTTQYDDYLTPIRRLLVWIVLLFLIAVFVLWRIDNPRVERFRAVIIDAIIPNMNWAIAPATTAVNLVRDFKSYAEVIEQNQELRRELQRMKSWKEAAIQLEQENARLLELNNLKLNPKFTFVSGIVIADSGSPFSQSVLLNVGERDGIVDGWPAMDGLGLVGRIAGIGSTSSRVMLLTDASSRVPIVVQPSGQEALVSGDNTLNPLIEFLKDTSLVRPGDRIVTSGRSGTLPPDLLIGQLVLDPHKRLRVKLAADYERLKFVRVLRDQSGEKILGVGNLLLPKLKDSSPKPTHPLVD